MEKLIELYNSQFGRKHLKEKYAKVWRGFWNVIIFAISLGDSYKNFDCYVNQYSLEVKNDSEQGVVLMSIIYAF